MGRHLFLGRRGRKTMNLQKERLFLGLIFVYQWRPHTHTAAAVLATGREHTTSMRVTLGHVLMMIIWHVCVILPTLPIPVSTSDDGEI